VTPCRLVKTANLSEERYVFISGAGSSETRVIFCDITSQKPIISVRTLSYIFLYDHVFIILSIFSCNNVR
jgi:hypothetical protein